MDPVLLAPFFMLALFVALWWLLGLLLAQVSGWHALAARHGDRDPSGGMRLRSMSARFRWVDFNHVLAIELDARGVRFALWPRFLAGFAPFHMAWSEFASITEVPGMFRRSVELVPREGGRIQLFGRAVDAVLAASKPGARFDATTVRRDDSARPTVLILAAAAVVMAVAVAAFLFSARA